ncbi:MAG: tRNA(fMet)-specific endonuclease VapC [Pseudohongiellaceae bacterium]
MKYLLDTDICIYLIKQKPTSVIQRLSTIPNDQVGLSAITVFELQFGVENSESKTRSQKALNHFLAPIQNILAVDQNVVVCAAKIRSDLKKIGKPIGPYDVLIAAVALSQKLILVSNNSREFQHVEGLKLENWAE